ncbi:MAG TPA: MXAN_5808 family serine peptidase [Polyangia bacterium]
MDLFEQASGPQPFMRRYFKPILVLVALVLALCITIRRAPHGHVDVGAGEPLRAAQKEDKRPYDLAALRIFNNTLMRVNDAYVDPTRVDPKEMLKMALDQVQKSVAEVIVEPKGNDKLVVRVDTAQQEFDIDKVDSPWALSMKMKEIFRFIAQNLPPGTDQETVRNTEYAATNGMLSTLDPHSMLLDPQTYTEMKLTTRGSFGGLGILIGLRKGELTVIKPYPDTPASKAGIKAGDRIIRIDNESTANMLINDAVSRLRGEPDTKVTIWVRKATEANAAARKIVLTRAIVSTHTVDYKMLKGNVGLIKLHGNFAGNTDEELRKALDDLKGKGLKAIIVDLRNNPGGLLDQAIKVADEFVDTGTIVTTVGYANKQREEKRATPGTQPHVPMAVLVNGGSASASEIVAGALKNLDRAVIIGQKTFGKGSVQVLYDNDDGSALKLTIAQYLTPGDVSIQSVGITPDVELDKVVIDKDKGVWLFRELKGMHEADLEQHLKSTFIHSGDKPFETFKYLALETPKATAKKAVKTPLRDDPRQADDDDDGPAIDQDEEDENPTDPDALVEDYEVDFARDLVSQAKGWKRREVLSSSKPFFDKKLAEEQARIVDSLKKLGIDWTPVGAGPAPTLVGTVSTDRPQNEVAAGETIKFTAKITNKGPGMAGQVRATLKGDDPFFDGRELVFGRIKPGETRSFTVPVKMPKDSLTRIDPLRLEVNEEHGAKTALDSNELLVRVDGPLRPIYSYAYQVIDDIKGNGDGLIERGESVRLHVTVKNSGVGKAIDTTAQLRNLSDEGVFINKGRFDLDGIGPGESKTIDFTFDVRPEYRANEAKVELTVYDQTLHEFVTDKLSFPIAGSAKPTESASGVVTASTAATQIYGGADKDAPLIGTADKGAAFKLTGTSGDYWRVELDGRPGFIAKTAAQKGEGAPSAKVAWTQAWQVSPPRLDVKAGAPLVDAPTFHLSSTAKDEHKVADMFVFVSNRQAKIDRRKVFYRSNRKAPNQAVESFDTDIPLWPGANVVTVVARESTQVQSQQTIVVERREPRVAQETHAKPTQPLEPGKSAPRPTTSHDQPNPLAQ